MYVCLPAHTYINCTLTLLRNRFMSCIYQQLTDLSYKIRTVCQNNLHAQKLHISSA